MTAETPVTWGRRNWEDDDERWLRGVRWGLESGLFSKKERKKHTYGSFSHRGGGVPPELVSVAIHRHR